MEDLSCMHSLMQCIKEKIYMELEVVHMVSSWVNLVCGDQIVEVCIEYHVRCAPMHTNKFLRTKELVFQISI